MRIIKVNNDRTQKNRMSMVMSLDYYGNAEEGFASTRMLFLGDFETVKDYQELYLKHQGEIKADVVMVPHHGSNTEGNGDPAFYEMVGAKYAIISSHIGCPY